MTIVDNIIVPYGPGTVDQWIDAGYSGYEMWSAHRGGSHDWPELSMRAYTQAVIRGYGCLEISVNRTSDGVYAAVHDLDIERVIFSPDTGLPPVSAMTWAQIQAYEMAGPVNFRERAPEPFERLETIVNTYKASHVFMIDPKGTDVSHYPELLDLLDTLAGDVLGSPGGKTRFIGKYVGDNQVWADALAERGYQSWGAYYDTDWATGGAGFPAASAAMWTLLGLNYDASSAHWTEIKATGKKVLGHICVTPADVSTARSKGADGFQVSGVEQIDPVTD